MRDRTKKTSKKLNFFSQS